MISKEIEAMSNLITDMALAGASEDELAEMIKYSMSLIDAEKNENQNK